MRRIIKTGGALLVVASWLALCGIGLSAPTFVRRPLAIGIENLKSTAMEFDAVETWDAVRPVTSFTKRMSDRTVFFSTLMLVGFIAFAAASRRTQSPNNTSEVTSGGRADASPGGTST